MNKVLLGMAIAACAAGIMTAAEVTPYASGSTVIAEVNGNRVTLSDLERKNPTALFQAQNSFYDSEKKAVDDFVDQYLLEEQAKKENVTVDELLKRHVNDALPKDPSDDALRVYYEGLSVTEPFEQVRDKIIEVIRQRRTSKLKKAYLESLRKAASVDILLGPPRIQISLKDTPTRGDASARVTVVEYADFECPYCQQAQPALAKLETEYRGKIVFAYKDTPLPMHPHAEKAAEAAHCAENQGKYWEFHDLLFSSKQLEVPQLKEQARKLKLDGTAFDKCLDSGEEASKVAAQLHEAEKLGIQGTPSFFINGHFVAGALDFDTLRGMVDDELRLSATPAPQTARR